MTDDDPKHVGDFFSGMIYRDAVANSPLTEWGDASRSTPASPLTVASLKAAMDDLRDGETAQHLRQDRVEAALRENALWQKILGLPEEEYQEFTRVWWEWANRRWQWQFGEGEQR